MSSHPFLRVIVSRISTSGLFRHQPTKRRALRTSDPRRNLAPLVRMPGHLHGAEDALGMRHQDREAAVGGGEAGDALRRAVRVVRIASRSAGRDGRRSAARRRLRRVELRASSRTRRALRRARRAIGMRLPAMPAKKSDGDRSDLDQHEARLELLGRGCARSAASAAAPGMMLAQVAHHLAAVADAEREGVAAREERRELRRAPAR